ncbi:hypothetical protein CFC21_066510 [Triticum aestivum]|nr:hypothetical protein CFC21_066510 [Triticum aestivum]
MTSTLCLAALVVMAVLSSCLAENEGCVPIKGYCPEEDCRNFCMRSRYRGRCITKGTMPYCCCGHFTTPPGPGRRSPLE